MLFCGRPIRLFITCLIAIGLGGGESCLCGSSLAAGSGSSHCAKPRLSAAVAVGSLGGACRCRWGCCQKPAPDKSVPLQQSRTNNAYGTPKVLSHYLVALTTVDASAGWSSGKSPYALASLLSPATLQLQHVPCKSDRPLCADFAEF